MDNLSKSDLAVDPRLLNGLYLQTVLDLCQKSARAIPQGKATWKPGDGNAKPALQVVQHMVEVNHAIATFIKTGKTLDATDKEKLKGQTATYPQALQALSQSTQVLIEAYASIPDERLKAALEKPADPGSLVRLMGVGLFHLTYHWGQLCYLQTLWDDPQDHFLKKE